MHDQDIELNILLKIQFNLTSTERSPLNLPSSHKNAIEFKYRAAAIIKRVHHSGCNDQIEPVQPSNLPTCLMQ